MKRQRHPTEPSGKVTLTPFPWYREPWPWILMAGPAAVIVAGAVTLWLAISTADGLVADDYYKRGLAINQDLKREQRAAQRGIEARVRLEPSLIRVELLGASPEALFVQLVHATRAGFDQRLRLARVAQGVYEAELRPLPPGHWRLILEDPRGEWRLTPTLTLPPRKAEGRRGSEEGA
ncbi:MAG TPA: FixH family protein [Burkholderiales bacterium]|nr:FixH family protein [Burkholderiales bacterium]